MAIRPTIFIALLLSAGAYCVGRYAEQTADRYMRHALYAPPRDAPGPTELLSGGPQEIVIDLDDNPFSHRDSSGVLIPKDPERRAMGEAATRCQQASNVAYWIAKIIPVAAVIVLLRKRREGNGTSSDPL